MCAVAVGEKNDCERDARRCGGREKVGENKDDDGDKKQSQVGDARIMARSPGAGLINYARCLLWKVASDAKHSASWAHSRPCFPLQHCVGRPPFLCSTLPRPLNVAHNGEEEKGCSTVRHTS